MAALSTYRYGILVWLVLFLGVANARAQEQPSIQWLTFEQLSDSLTVNPKKVLISFHTDWCTYCRKMHREVFTKPAVVEIVNADYYAVQFDAESTDTVHFDGQAFVNNQATQRRKGFHDIALLLGSRNGTFTVPVTMVLDQNFTVLSRHFEYLDSRQLDRKSVV